MIVGVLGGGQLGRMLALAGYPLGLQCRFLDPSPEAPAGLLAEHVHGDYDDPQAREHFARGVHVVTYEFENVPVAAVRELARQVPVYPPVEALEVSQDRLTEKTFFQRLGLPVPAFLPVSTWEDLQAGLTRLGLPAVLKTQRLGYDGKGQSVLRRPEDARPAWALLGEKPLLLESFVPFDREVSLVAVRGRDGSTAFYPLIENDHEGGMLRWSLAPAPGLTPALQRQAEDAARLVLEALQYVGVLVMEYFQVGGQLLINEMAPRVHNSGHWTIEGAETSQFDNHLRAVVGLPLGLTEPLGYSAMLNLIGTLPDAPAILAVPGAHLHLYGKSPRPGRKLGHVTLRAPDRTACDAGFQRLYRQVFGEHAVARP